MIIQVLSWKLYETGEISDKKQIEDAEDGDESKNKNEKTSSEPKSPLDGLDKDTVTCMEVCNKIFNYTGKDLSNFKCFLNRGILFNINVFSCVLLQWMPLGTQEFRSLSSLGFK